MDLIWSDLEFEPTDLIISPENILLNKKHLTKTSFPKSFSTPLFQKSPLRKQHRTTAAAIKVVNSILHAVDEKLFCLSPFKDFSKAFDAVNNSVLLDRLKATGFSDHAAGWFSNYLLGRTQSSSHKGLWYVRHIKKGVSQGLVLELLLFTIYINCLKISTFACCSVF